MGRPAKQHDIGERYRHGWLSTLDGRETLTQELRARYETICSDLGGVDSLSYMQRSLVERGLWLERWLALQERELGEGKEFDVSRWIQAANSLQGIYKSLGLERRARDVPTLQSYLNGKAATA